MVLFVSTLWADDNSNCYSVVVGKDASEDGHVIMAHNEDDTPPQVVHHRKVPRKKYSSDETVILVNGGQLDQIDETWAFIWSEMPEMTFSDSYLNEWGVCIASDACPSREDQSELTDGGISYMLRRLVALRAKTAREGVLLAGDLIEQFGYDASGRTYTICDPEEGWLLCAVNGKHWLAQRVPDDHVAIIANTYTVHDVDLADTVNFLASSDIIEYAVSRGWYDPESDGAFDFAAVYADPDIAADSGNFCRQWGGLRYVAAEPIGLNEHLPFSVKPKKKLSTSNVMQILRDHYENTEFYQGDPEMGNPHRTGVRTICTWTTQTSFVAQLRSGPPADIGLVYWVCLGPPCTSFYTPFYFGLKEFPAGYASDKLRPSKYCYRECIKAPFAGDAQKAFWTSHNFYQKVCADYENISPALQSEIETLQDRTLALQKSLERTAGELYATDRDAALELLENFSEDSYRSTMEIMEKLLSVE
jgi:dipeptidase